MAKWITEQRQEALQLAEATTIQEAASKIGIPEGTIKRWRSEERRRSKQKSKPSEPPNRTERTEPINGHAGRASDEQAAFDGQCAATTLAGTRCKTKAMPGSEYCRRHANAVENQCNAISKQTGRQCRNKAMPGKTKCKFHGGASTGPPPGSQNNLKHGLNSRFIPGVYLDDLKQFIEADPEDLLKLTLGISAFLVARSQEVERVSNGHLAALGKIGSTMATITKTLREKELDNLKVEKLKVDIAKITGDDEIIEDDGFIEALNAEVSEVWSDEED